MAFTLRQTTETSSAFCGLDGAISEFRINVHLFEAVSSPAVANYSLHKTAETGRAEFGDKAGDFMCRNFYVDDGVTAVPTISEAMELIGNSQALFASAKLRLHKFSPVTERMS